MKILTFQSQEVIKNVLLNGIYFSDNKLSRERRDYKADIAQLGGFNPIWCFASTKDRDFTSEDFTDGSLLERFRCEMSLNQETGLSAFMLLELDVNENEVFTGITHNAYDGAKVIPSISLDQLIAIYKVVPTTHWYYKNIRLLTSYGRTDLLFPDGLKTIKRKVVNNVIYEIFTEGLVGNKKTQHYASIDNVMTPATVVEVSYSGDFYKVMYDNRTLEVETIYTRVPC